MSQTEERDSRKSTSTNRVWVPPSGRNNKLETYINCVRTRVKNEILTKPLRAQQNLNALERRAISELRSNRNIIIKPADKGGATVVMNSNDYMVEAYRQLRDPTYYTQLAVDPTKQYTKELNDLLKSCSPMTQNRMQGLIPKDPKPGIFYMLPKIHKINNPGRPIVSGIGTLTEGISGYVAKLLNPVAASVDSFLQDTRHFQNILEDECANVPDGALLVTMDVSSLYTNIPPDDGITAMIKFYNQFYGEDGREIPSPDLAKIVRFILTHNNFVFNDEHYLQVMGTAMGTRMAPPYAILFLADLEGGLLATHPYKPLVYRRYIDDVFLIWCHGHESLAEFHRAFNDIHHSIKLTCDSSDTSVNFLDTTVSIVGGSLTTGLYRKPTNRNALLHAHSFHPAHVKRSVVYSQAIRFHRICSDQSERDRELGRLRLDFLNRGYSHALVDREIERAISKPRQSLMVPTENNERGDSNITPFITTYHPSLRTLSKILRDLQPLLQDESLGDTFAVPPRVIFRQPHNIRHDLVCSRFPCRMDPDIAGTFPCRKPRCLTCGHIATDTILENHGKRLQIMGQYSCESMGVVYLITCTLCPDLWYFGETSGTLRSRMNGHRQTVNTGNLGVPVGQHFNSPGHCLANLRIRVVAGGLPDIFDRRRKEIEYIFRFNTHVSGLNRDIGFMTHYVT